MGLVFGFILDRNVRRVVVSKRTKMVELVFWTVQIQLLAKINTRKKRIL